MKAILLNRIGCSFIVVQKNLFHLMLLNPEESLWLSHVLMDANHAGDRVTHRSHTGVILFCYRAPILWYSKQQTR